jgi:cysteine-rich repeat protein
MSNPPTCGDGHLDPPGEECDDGNLVNDDGCSSTCKLEVGELCSFTPGGWGAECNGKNAGCVRDAGFAAAFPSGLSIGDPNGLDGASGGFAALWTTPQALESFLPAGGTGGSLTADATNPTSTSAGALAGHLVSVKLNLGIAGLPGDLRFISCVEPELELKTIAEVVAIADAAVASGALPAGVSFSDLTSALTAVNENFDNCNSNEGCLGE